MDFGALPPEVNSLRMYSGPGSAPMLAAMTAWDGLAEELHWTAASYEMVISGLISEGWLGPASASMAAAVTPYVAWMNISGAQAEQTAMQAAAAAAAFEAAFAMTVPPAVVAANRAQLMVLVATNFFGQNTAAIAATEAEYGEMWAQDAAAMYGYATSSAAASALTPFTEPAPATNPAGQADQAAAVSQAANSAAGTIIQSELQQLMSSVTTTLQGLSSPSPAAVPNSIPGADWLAGILNFLDGNDGNAFGTFLNSTLTNGVVSAGYVSPPVISPALTGAMSDFTAITQGAPEAAAPAVGSAAGSTAGSAGLSGVSGLGGVTAGANQASFVGRLSVPQGWTATTAVANHSGAAVPIGGAVGTSAGPGPAGGMPGVPGIPVARGYGYSYGSGPRYGFKPTIVGRPPAAG